MRISAAQCVCVLSDGGCHGGSPVDLVGHVDLVGYVRVPCRLSGRLVAFLEFCSQFMRISAAHCVCCVCGISSAADAVR